MRASVNQVIFLPIALLALAESCAEQTSIGSPNPIILVMERRLQDNTPFVQFPNYVLKYREPVASPALAQDACRLYIEKYGKKIGHRPHWSKVLESPNFYYIEGFRGYTVIAVQKGKSELTIWKNWEPLR